MSPTGSGGPGDVTGNRQIPHHVAGSMWERHGPRTGLELVDALVDEPWTEMGEVRLDEADLA